MTTRSDILVVGGGPAGAAAAWRAAQSGANVICLDKARFPRDKPCGDGLTPRAVKLISDMGLEDDLAKFHEVNRMRVFSSSVFEVSWPDRPGLPKYGYVARRLDLDDLLLRTAGQAGVHVEQNTEVTEPIFAGDRVVGVKANHDGAVHEYRADVVIAADGAHSRLKRSFKANPDSGLLAVAIRAEMGAQRESSHTLEAYLLKHENELFPGYGWVFPVGGDRFNIGVGHLISYRRWRSINARTLFDQFLHQLPAEWELPQLTTLYQRKAVQAWRLPMGFARRDLWQPGVLFAGDAAGVAKPAGGAGISRALQSGMIAADVAVDTIGSGSPDKLSNYEKRLRKLWRKTDRRTAALLQFARNPHSIALGIKALDHSLGRRTLIKGFYNDMNYQDLDVRNPVQEAGRR
jgi:menaquinone-9 beta-reductase